MKVYPPFNASSFIQLIIFYALKWRNGEQIKVKNVMSHKIHLNVAKKSMFFYISMSHLEERGIIKKTLLWLLVRKSCFKHENSLKSIHHRASKQEISYSFSSEGLFLDQNSRTLTAAVLAFKKLFFSVVNFSLFLPFRFSGFK